MQPKPSGCRKKASTDTQIATNFMEFIPLAQEQQTQTNNEPDLVLVVEDNDDVRNYLRMNLSADYTVIEAANGSDGLKKAIETIPDLIISDIMMPGLNGLELCQKLKTDEKPVTYP